MMKRIKAIELRAVVYEYKCSKCEYTDCVSLYWIENTNSKIRCRQCSQKLLIIKPEDVIKELEELTRLWKIQQERAWETGYLAGAEDCIDDINGLITKLRNEG